MTLTGPYCGDALTSNNEICDDGNNTSESTCAYGTPTCSFCNADCTGVLALMGPYCGDAVTSSEEECDDGNNTTELACAYGAQTCTACNANCTDVLTLTGPYCGDALTSNNEICDDGNNTSESTCAYGTQTCEACNADCTDILTLTGPYCGDAVTSNAEECDDGNNTSELACAYGTKTCEACNANCTDVLTLTGPYCGDAVKSSEEECDDGNQIETDACLNNCTTNTAVDIAFGDAHTCALLAGGQVKCWGNNDKGQLGQNNLTNLPAPPTTAIDFGNNATAISIAAGGQHTCAIVGSGSSGAVKCWGYGGYGGYGQLGSNATANIGDGVTGHSTVANSAPVDLGNNSTAIAITAGTFHTCALLTDGAVKCWGRGENGRLGNNATVNIGNGVTGHSTVADSIVDFGGDNATAIAAGALHTCALFVGGAIKCWGSGANGRLETTQ